MLMKQFEVRKYTSSGRKRAKDELKASYYSKYMVKCKCGHTFLMFDKEPKKLCTNCGTYYYKDKKLEFKNKLKEKLRNARKDN